MADDFRPKHLRGLENVPLSPDEERELMDLRTGLDRVRRRVQSEEGHAEKPWGFPFPQEAAELFDALPSPFTVEEAQADRSRATSANRMPAVYRLKRK